MATATMPKEQEKVELAIELPSHREYDDPVDAELDERLVATIASARQAENDYLATVLSHELGSHYYDTR